MVISYVFKFGFSDVFLIIMGLLVGFMWGLMFVISRKKKLILSHIKKNNESLLEEQQESIQNNIDNALEYHKKTKKKPFKLFFGLITIKRKNKNIEYAKKYLNLDLDTEQSLPLDKEIEWLSVNTAKVFFTESKYPLYEVSINETFIIANEVLDMINQAIYDLGIPNLDEVKLSTILHILKISKQANKVYNYKGIQICISIVNGVLKLKSLISPIYWIKKGTNKVTSGSLNQVFVEYLFDIIGKEIAYIYSKGYMVKEETIVE